MSCDHLCYVALSHGAVSWSVVYDCGIVVFSDHTHLPFGRDIHGMSVRSRSHDQNGFSAMLGKQTIQTSLKDISNITKGPI